MNFIKTKSVSLPHIIFDIANELKATVKENCGEYSIEIPTRSGAGVIKMNTFKNGLALLQWDCYFHKTVEFQFSNQTCHSLKFLYCLEGEITQNFQYETEPRTMAQYQHVIVAPTQETNYTIRFHKNKRIKLFGIEVVREEFLCKIDYKIPNFNLPLENILQDVEANSFFYYQGLKNLELADMYGEINNPKAHHFLDKIFLKGQAYRLLSHHMLAFIQETELIHKENNLRKAEITLIKNAAALILLELSQPLTIENLAKRVGLNPNKLQMGFKTIFQLTVNKYIRRKRLERAKLLLKTTDFSISQISEEIGISSVSYFSKIFREEYGEKPSIFKEALKVKC